MEPPRFGTSLVPLVPALVVVVVGWTAMVLLEREMREEQGVGRGEWERYLSVRPLGERNCPWKMIKDENVEKCIAQETVR